MITFSLRSPARAIFAAASLLLLATLGCSDAKTPPLAPVTGYVSVGNEPLVGAHVIFKPASGIKFEEGVPYGRELLAKTDSSGFFRLTHHSGKRGAEIGEHQVKIEIPGLLAEEIPEGANSQDIYYLTMPTRVDVGGHATTEVVDGSNELKFELPEDAIPSDRRQRALGLMRGEGKSKRK